MKLFENKNEQLDESKNKLERKEINLENGEIKSKDIERLIKTINALNINKAQGELKTVGFFSKALTKLNDFVGKYFLNIIQTVLLLVTIYVILKMQHEMIEIKSTITALENTKNLTIEEVPTTLT